MKPAPYPGYPLALSADGVVGCTRPGHAPLHGSRDWARGGWRVLTPDRAADFAAELGAPARCDACMRAEQRAAARPPCPVCGAALERSGHTLCRACFAVGELAGGGVA